MKKLNVLFGLSMFLIIGSLFLAYFVFINNPHVIAIHFDVLSGIDYFGTRADIFGVLLVALVINFVNTAIAKSLHFRENFLAISVAVANFIFMALIFVAIIVIAMNN